MASDIFIVQVAWRVFYESLRDGEINTTPYPSCAVHMDYSVADQVCQRIRARGYDEAVVCDQRGAPCIAADIERATPVSEAKVAQYYDDCVTPRDWEILRGLTSGEDAVELGKRLNIKPEDLNAAIADANRRISEECSKLHKSNTEKHHFTDQVIRDTEAKRNSRQ